MRPRIPGAARYRASHRSITPSTHGFRPRGGRIHELEEEDMKISVIGCGYLGAVHAAAMAELGHEVVGVDVDPGKVEALSAARAPFFEPGFEELLARTLGTGRLRFSTDMAAAAGCAVHFVCVGTPQKRGEYAADLRYVQGATESLLGVLGAGELVVCKSTVPVGTEAGLAALVAEKVPGRCWPGIRSSSGRASQLADAIGYDERIGRRFLNAGLGFGGGCLPKDIRAFMARAGELGADQALTFLKEVDNINMRRRI